MCINAEKHTSKCSFDIPDLDGISGRHSHKWEKKNPDVAYIVEYIKRSAAANKLPFP
jgi:hypothetical protein